MRRPVPLFARGPRDNGEFSALKQVLAHNSVVFPGENRTTVTAACLFLASFQIANIYKLKHSMQAFSLNFPEETFFFHFKHDNAITETKCPCQMFLSRALPGGSKSFSLCVSPRMAVEGLNNQSLYIILCPAGLVDATTMSC